VSGPASPRAAEGATAAGRVRLRLGLLAWTAALAIQTGGLDVYDTRVRLQVAHWLWAGGEQVPPEDQGVRFGVPGRGGKLQAWYGIGQSLVMLPADFAASQVARALKLEGRKEELFHQFAVAYLTFPWITAASVVVAYSLLLELGFTPRRALFGGLALLFGTTFFHYAQHHQENSLMMLAMVCGTYGALRWRDTGATRPLVLGMLALGFNILIRLPGALDVAAVGALAAALAWLRARRAGEPAGPRLARLVLVVVASSALYLFIDRLYHFARFGSFLGTYLNQFPQVWRRRDPSLPEDFPYNTTFRAGFLGALFSPHKSVFLFDPLLALTLLAFARGGRRIRAGLWAWLVAFAALLLADVAFYARVVFWGGDSAWGDRYVLVPVWMIALVGVPLLMELWGGLGRPERALAWALIVVAVVVQLASVSMSSLLEVAQRNCRGDFYLREYHGPRLFVVGRRFVNLAETLLGRDRGPAARCEDQALRNFGGINLTPFRLGQEKYRGLVPERARLALVAGWAVLVAAVLWQVLGLVARPRAVEAGAS
jgi:hypothetical protein